MIFSHGTENENQNLIIHGDKFHVFCHMEVIHPEVKLRVNTIPRLNKVERDLLFKQRLARKE